MNEPLFQNKIVAKKSSVHGHGVFADKDIAKGDLIEECRCIFFNCKDNCLDTYAFDVQGSKDESMILTGYGCLYNHSDQHNAYYAFDKENSIMRFTTSRAINAGEEIFISYGPNWFSSRKVSTNIISLWRKLFCNPFKKN
jgi:SET domain-containing protein